MKSVWHTKYDKPKECSKVEVLYDNKKPTEVDYFENGDLMYIKWDEVILWRYVETE